MGVIFRVFRALVFFAKIIPTQKKTYMPFCRKYEYPHVKCLANIFAKISPSLNNHDYTVFYCLQFVLQEAFTSHQET